MTIDNIFLIFAPNIDCGYSLELPRRLSSNDYPQSMSPSQNMKNNLYPGKPHFFLYIPGCPVHGRGNVMAYCPRFLDYHTMWNPVEKTYPDPRSVLFFGLNSAAQETFSVNKQLNTRNETFLTKKS